MSGVNLKRIKKDPFTLNEYIFAGGMWVRNFTKFAVKSISINNLIKSHEYEILLRNETANDILVHAPISEEKINFSNLVIVSDGYDFAKRHKQLASLPEGIGVFAVNGALAKWSLLEGDRKKSINAYIVNNPFAECMNYLPKASKYYPPCIASSRTHIDFVKQYLGNVYTYEPVMERNFGRDKKVAYYIDDYRNSICAAIGLAYRCGVRKLLLMCCDDSFEKPRPTAVQLSNGLWTYDHHKMIHEVIDANLYWLKSQKSVEVKIADYSSGEQYDNADYISTEEQMIDFFKKEQELKNG
jgi:hypothetical protein